jgi:hypothetical protein
MSDGLSKLYQELLSGSYDCVDRIVLNAYFGMVSAQPPIEPALMDCLPMFDGLQKPS